MLADLFELWFGFRFFAFVVCYAIGALTALVAFALQGALVPLRVFAAGRRWMNGLWRVLASATLTCFEAGNAALC